MNTYIFSLGEYFETTQKYYYFFDGLMLYEKKLKKDVLKTVDVYEVSYRADRLKSKVKNNNRNLLLNYFNYNDVEQKDRLKYEICISKIYYCTYYVKLDVLKELLLELDSYIEENNYLRPLFVLFKVFGSLPFHKYIEEVKEAFADDVNYLKSFVKSKYFTEEFGYLVQTILLYFETEVNMIKLDEYSNIYREFRWFDYTIRASYYYLKENDADALIYYNAALEEFNKSYNVERYLRTINNIAVTYNNLDKYQLSLNVTEKVIKYAFSQELNIWIKAIAMHYLFSIYMLKRFDEVLEFYNVIVLNEKFLNEVSIIIIILSAFKLKRMEQVDSLIKKSKDLKNVKLFLSIIESTDEEEIIDLSHMSPTPYLVKLTETL